jgi:hypothetical protein
LKLTPIAKQLSKRGFEMGSLTTPPSTPIYLPSTVASAAEWWTSLRADSHARTSASLDTELDSTGIEAVFGGRCLDAFGTWDPDTSSLRTYQGSFWEDKPAEWLESFPRSGTIRSGTAYRLRPLVPRTYDGGGGVLGLKSTHHLPTPNVAGTYTSNLVSTQIDFESNHSVDLAQWVAKWPTPRANGRYQGDGAARGWLEAGFKQPTHRYDKEGQVVSAAQGTFDTTLSTAVQAYDRWQTPMWPTPGAHEDRAERYTLETSERHLREGRQVHLAQVARMFPTPRASKMTDENEESWLKRHDEGNVATPPLALAARMWGSPRAQMTRDSSIDGNKSNLEEQVGQGKLSPDWVSWLMGLPIGWACLDPLSRAEYDHWFQAQVNGTWWTEERGLPRVGTDIPDRVQRLTVLGNGIVPGVVARFVGGMAYD